MEFLCDIATKIIKEYQETHFSTKIYCRCLKVLISAKKSKDMLPNYVSFKKKALKELPLDGSANFLSLVVQEFLNFLGKDHFHMMSE